MKETCKKTRSPDEKPLPHLAPETGGAWVAEAKKYPVLLLIINGLLRRNLPWVVV